MEKYNGERMRKRKGMTAAERHKGSDSLWRFFVSISKTSFLHPYDT